ncbi:MAG: hypothetical protein JNM18_22035 [Planctomycetaceae bacterium]|nr:hypothetical protein [Planctomycetaceae bacterium]
MYRSFLFALSATLLLACAVVVEAARVEIVLLTESGAGQQVQDWYRILTDLQVDSLQIRGNSGNEKVEVVKNGAGYRVTGMLNGRNEIVLPGGRYTLSDRARLSEWLKTLRSEGVDRALGAPRPPFNIPAELLKPVREEFAKSIVFETLDIPLASFLEGVGGQLRTPLVIDPAAAGMVKSDQNKVRDELRGLATGAALAAALRPVGLVLVPRLNLQRRVELAVNIAGQSTEFWPIGWAPTADRPESQVIPALHEVRDVELDEVPVMDLVAVVAERLKTPVLMDHNGIARQGLKPADVKVSLKPSKLSYGVVLGRTLVKAKLRYEIRIDDAGKPFVWIMSYISPP